MSRFLPFFLLAVAAAAQTPPPISCFANSGVPPVVRAEDFAALVGDIVLTCTGGDPSQRVSVDLTLTLNTYITSRLISAQLSEAELLIDEPGLARLNAAGQPTSATTPFCVSPNAASNSLPPSCNPVKPGETYQQGTYTVFYATPSAPHRVTWPGIPVIPPGRDKQRVFRLVNIRANAAALGTSATLIPSQILAHLSATGLSIDNPDQTVAFAQRGMLFDLRKCDGSTQNAGATFTLCSPTAAQRDFYDNPTRSGTLPANGSFRFREGFQTAFLPRTVDGQQSSIPGVVYNTESGFIRPETGSAGLADSGARLSVQFRNIPAGVRIFVSRTHAAGSTEGSRATLVASNLPAATSTITCGTSSTPAIEVPLTNGTGAAAWEVTASNPSSNEVFLFTYAIAYRETGTALGKGEVIGNLAPAFESSATVTTMQPSTVPIPRSSARTVADDLFYMNACNANVTIVSTPAGTPVFVDGVQRTTPATFPWLPGETHVIDGRTYVQSAGARLRFAGWNVGGAAQQNFTVTEPVTLIASFVQQYAVSLTAGAGGTAVSNPPISGDGYFDRDTLFRFEAVPFAGNVIAGWTGVDPAAVPEKAFRLTAPVAATVTFKAGSCAAKIDPAQLTIPAPGGYRSVSFVRDPACGMGVTTATSDPWIHFGGTGGEAGRQMVWLGASANTGATARSTKVTIADVEVTVVQPGAGCSTTLSSPASVTLRSDGGPGELTVISSACAWAATSDRAWLQVYPLSGSGAGTVHYNGFPNFSGVLRQGSINVGDSILTFYQDAALPLSGHTDQERARFVRRLYYNYLGRLPAENELLFHVMSGQPREQLALNFLNSAEFNNGGRFVAGLYVGILNRDAEYGGWLFQRDALVRNITNHDTMVSTFINGPEFALKYGTLSNAAFTQLMYQQILGRQASPEEVAWRVGLLAGGFARVTMARDLLNSTEFRQGKNARLMSFLLHATILNRDPTAAEFTARRDQIAAAPTEATTRAILTELVQSVEVTAQVR